MEMGSAHELRDNLSDLLHSPANDSLRFTDQERRILHLWDQEQELLLEYNLLQAQAEGQQLENLSEVSDADIHEQIAQAEKSLLTARSKYNIRSKVIEQALITDPVLKGVHSGANVTELETRLVPLINERDTISMVHAVLSSRLQALNQKLAALERENIKLNETNRNTTQKMLELVNDAKLEKLDEIMDPQARAQLEKLDDDLTKTRQEWRVLKSVTAGLIAGSGVDWAKDSKLLQVVMDEEDELG